MENILTHPCIVSPFVAWTDYRSFFPVPIELMAGNSSGSSCAGTLKSHLCVLVSSASLLAERQLYLWQLRTGSTVLTLCHLMLQMILFSCCFSTLWLVQIRNSSHVVRQRCQVWKIYADVKQYGWDHHPNQSQGPQLDFIMNIQPKTVMSSEAVWLC